MNNVKKLLFTFGIVLILVAACSLSAFAYEPGDTFDFQLSSFPVNDMTNSNTRQSWSYFIQNQNYEVLYIEMWAESSGGRFGSEVAYTMGSFYDSSLQRFRFLPCFVNYGLNSNTTVPTTLLIRVYDVTGSLVNSYSCNRSVYGRKPSFTWIDNWTNLGNDYSRPSVMADVDSWFPIVSPSKFSVANETIQNNLPSGFPDVLWGYYDTDQPTEMGTCSIDATILVNGQQIYTSGGGTPSASVISGSASGSVPDGQGGSQDVNFDINLEMPEYDGDIGTDEFPTMPEFDDSSLSVIDGGSALQWVYARVNDLVTNNQKIFALVTSCLSLGVIMLILNKRS